MRLGRSGRRVQPVPCLREAHEVDRSILHGKVHAVGDDRREACGAGDCFREDVLAGVDGDDSRSSFEDLPRGDARHWGLDWADAVRWGAAAGSLTVVRRGLATADRREIHQLLSKVQLAKLTDP